MNASQSMIYGILSNYPEYTIEDIVSDSGFSDGYVRKMLNQLKEKNRLKRIGSKKSGYWKVK